MTESINLVYFSTISMCFLAGFVPTIGTEVALASIGLLIKPNQIIPLAFVGALSQTVSKLFIYFLSSKTLSFLSFKRKRKLIMLRRKYYSRKRLTAGIIFVSALTGLPPYYLINIICGIVNSGWLTFGLLGLSGMFMRFSLCLAFPQMILHSLPA
jgi:membrane protein YqaA with SNARE-associated domain